MHPKNQQGIAQVAILILLLLGLIGGVFLVQRQTSLKSRASLTGTRVEIFGPSVNGDVATSRNVKLRLVYVPPAQPSPTAVSTPTPVAPQSCSSMNLRPSFYIAPYSPRGVNADGDVANCFLRSDTPTGIGTDEKCLDGGENGPRTKLRQALMSGSLAFREFGITRNASDLTSRMFLRSDDTCWQGAKAVLKGRSCDSWGPLVPSQAEINSLIADINSGVVYLPGVCGGPAPSPVAQPSATAVPPVFPTHFRVANAENDLTSASVWVFLANNTEMDWTLAEGENGPRMVYAQFKVNNVWESPISSTINLQIPAPSFTPTPTAEPTQAPTPNVSPGSLGALVRTATLSVSPTSGIFNKGCTFNVDVNLNTGGQPTDGTDAILLYDPTRLIATGISVGSIYANYPTTTINNSASISIGTIGKVTISGIAPVTAPFPGSGKLATVNFMVRDNATIGTTSIDFDFDPNNLTKVTDSNVILHNNTHDILASVSNGTYTIGTGSCAPTSTVPPAVVLILGTITTEDFGFAKFPLSWNEMPGSNVIYKIYYKGPNESSYTTATQTRATSYDLYLPANAYTVKVSACVNNCVDSNEIHLPILATPTPSTASPGPSATTPSNLQFLGCYLNAGVYVPRVSFTIPDSAAGYRIRSTQNNSTFTSDYTVFSFDAVHTRTSAPLGASSVSSDTASYEWSMAAWFSDGSYGPFVNGPTADCSGNIIPAPSATTASSPVASPRSSEQCANLGARIITSFQQSCGSTNYDPVADINKDRVVNTADASLMLSRSNENGWCSQQLNDNISPCSGTAVIIQTNTGILGQLRDLVRRIFGQ